MLLSTFAAVLLTASTTFATPRVVTDSVTRVTAVAPETWQVDRSHSEVSFRIRHFMSRVRGTFTDWNGTVVVDPANWSSAQVNVSIRTASINTAQERRDAHLRSPDFFAADSFPTITYASRKVTRTGDDLVIEGVLTMRGVSKPVTLTGKVLGVQKESRGRERAGVEASATINRLDYGVSWNRAAEGGGAVLGDEVTIEIALELVKQAPEAAAAPAK